MPQLSIVIPAFNNSRYLPDCVHSVTHQHFRDVEVIIVDDCSTDDTYEVASQLEHEDSRVRLIQHDKNSGTLASRKTGVLASQGQFIMLMDQDDELADGALQKLIDFGNANPADIYHFGVQVVAANKSAQDAAAGMTSFLTPCARTLHDADILKAQFNTDNGFDWHVHHKMYRGDFARTAYSYAADQRLVLSDDLYMSFIFGTLASTYIGIPDSPWYLYHLGRGDTLGTQLTVQSISTMAQRDAQAFSMVGDFAKRDNILPLRNDWHDRLDDVRNRLIEHAMNEWQDNLPSSDKSEGLQNILTHWQADAVCGELYRYIRDYAYAYLVADNRSSDVAINNRKLANQYLQNVELIESAHSLPQHSTNQHYLDLRTIARQHLLDSGIINAETNQDQSTRASRLKIMLKKLFSSH